ncbi:hypothetical protein AVEN_21878-1, partial [Araneus ventricosus]
SHFRRHDEQAATDLQLHGTATKKNTNLTSVQFNPVKPVIIIGDDKGSVISFKLSPNLRSSLKAFQTLERTKFAAAEKDKMEKS